MGARVEFYKSIEILLELSAHHLLTDVFPPSAPENQRSRILRNGLVVSAFSMLETYLEDRLDEVILELPQTTIPYTAFSEDLRSFLSLNAIAGLGNRIGFLEKSDRLAYAEAQLLRLSAGGNIGYTNLGFSPKGSNISLDDLTSLLKAFGITDVWPSLSRLRSDLGSSTISFADDFRNLLRDRNKAAHDSNTNIATNDLTSHLSTALLVGMTTDLAITHAVTSFVQSTTIPQALNQANTLPTSFRFLDEELDGKWLERASRNGRAIKRYPDKASAKIGAKGRTATSTIVLRNSSLLPFELLE